MTLDFEYKLTLRRILPNIIEIGHFLTKLWLSTYGGVFYLVYIYSV